jgi:hypothetical protein
MEYTEYRTSSYNVVDRFLAATDELLDFTKSDIDQGIPTFRLVQILKKYCPDQWRIEEDDDECE